MTRAESVIRDAEDLCARLLERLDPDDPLCLQAHRVLHGTKYLRGMRLDARSLDLLRVIQTAAGDLGTYANLQQVQATQD